MTRTGMTAVHDWRQDTWSDVVCYDYVTTCNSAHLQLQTSCVKLSFCSVTR